MKRYSACGILLAVLPLFFGCEDQLIDRQNIPITYSLIDSVSPLRVVLRVNKALNYAQWTINDSIYVNNHGYDTVELILDKPGINHIELVASGENNTYFKGSIDIDVPGVASKLQIYGFFFKNNYKFPIDRDSVQVMIYHNNDSDNPYYIRRFSTFDFLGQDTFLLTTPIVLNVFNSVDITDAHLSNLYFILEDVPIYDIEDIPAGYIDGTLSGPLHKTYFRSNTAVTQAYWDRLWMPPHQMQLFGDPELTKEVRLLVNWN